jgi:hypothetical protein
LTFEPKPGGVEVKMASEVLLPLTKQFRTASASIEYVKRYIASIKDPEVRAKFEKEFGTKILEFQAPSVAAFSEIYRKIFPPGTAPAPLRKDQEKLVADRVRPLVTQAEKLLEGIKTWAAAAGIEGLSKEDFDRTITTKGKPIWDEEFKQVQNKIKAVLNEFNYRGSPIEFRGSTQTGLRSPAKGKTLFDAADFDVDMYVVHEKDFTALERLGRTSRDFIGADADDTPLLLDLQTKVRAKLVATFPDVARIAGSTIVLRKVKKA